MRNGHSASFGAQGVRFLLGGLFSALLIGLPAYGEDPVPAEAPSSVPDQWLIMDSLHGTEAGDFMEENRINLYGWTQGSYTASSSGTDENTPLLFQNPTGRFLLNQNWVVLERTVDTTASEPTWGVHSAWILPGSDARYTISRGLFDEQTGRNRIDPFRLYAELYIPTVAQGMSLIFGKNAVPHFYEVQDAALNSLFSHSYIYYYGGPFTHTGLEAKIKLSDEWTVDARLVTGSDLWFDEAASPTFVGTALYTAPDGNDLLSLAMIAGSGTYDVGEEYNHYNMLNAVYTHKFSDKLSYVLDTMIGYQRNAPDVDTAVWYAAANYLTYAFCDKMSATVRAEVFQDDDGVRTGDEGLYTEGTIGVAFKPRNDVIIRPEIRYDYHDGGDVYAGEDDMVTGAVDLILRW